MNTLLISAAAPNNAVAHKATTPHARSDRDTEADQTPAFADVFVSQAAPESRSSGTPSGGNDTGRNKEGSAQNPDASQAAATSKAGQDHHRVDRNRATLASASGPLSTLTTTAPLLDGDLTAKNHHYLKGALPTTGDPDETASLPNRFSQIIAALPKNSNDAAHKDIDRTISAEGIRIAHSDKTGRHNPDHINAHQSRRNAWQHQSQMTSLNTAASVSDAAVKIKGADRAVALNTETVAFEKFLSQDTTAGLRDLPAIQTMAAGPEGINIPGLTPIVGFSSELNTAHGAGAPFSTATIDRPLHHAQWGAELGRQFAALIRPGENGNQVAELRLDPPELGPLRVTININDSVVQAMFTSSHAAVRNAIEQALPQLQQQLEQEGLSLGQTSVDQGDDTSDSSFDTAVHNTQAGDRSDLNASDETHATPTRPRAPDGLIDTFA